MNVFVAHAPSWRRLLSTDDADRRRVLDLVLRLRRASRDGMLAFVAATAVAVPIFGWAPLAAVVAGSAATEILRAHLERLRRPLLATAVVWLLVELDLAAAVVVSHGPRLYLLTLLVFPATLAGLILAGRTAAAVAAAAMLLGVGAAFASGGGAALATPPLLLFMIVTIGASTGLAATAQAAEVASQKAASVDALTGALNRAALAARWSELRDAGAPAAVVVGDVDRFKIVNDLHGHARGDAVLQEIVRRLHAELGTRGEVYRLGGDEFAVLVPEADEADAGALAALLRDAVAAAPLSGLAVTMSFGVAALHTDLDVTLDRADAALYAAKGDGRDGVATADTVPPRWEAAPSRAPGAAPPARARAIERAHFLDLNRRLLRVQGPIFASVFVALVASAPWLGWWPLVPGLLPALLVNRVQLRLEQYRRPEYAYGGAILLLQAANVAALAIAHGSPLYILPAFAATLVTYCTIFPGTGSNVAIATNALLIAGGAFAAGAGTVVHDPALLALPLALNVAVGRAAAAAGASALEHRAAAVVDPLTGLLNRAALEARTAELARQQPPRPALAIVVGDVDCFKELNDRFGHAHGDAVLREVAARIHGVLRRSDSVFRFGGEEFVIVLTGPAAAHVADVAERVRLAVREQPVARTAVTISLGASIADAGADVHPAALLERADDALYRAKHAGRDAVAIDDSLRRQVAAGPAAAPDAPRSVGDVPGRDPEEREIGLTSVG